MKIDNTLQVLGCELNREIAHAVCICREVRVKTCGPGRFLFLFSRNGARVGLDPAPSDFTYDAQHVFRETQDRQYQCAWGLPLLPPFPHPRNLEAPFRRS